MKANHSPLVALGRGLVAGLIGTAAMTAYQTASSIRKGSSLEEAVAPEPAEEWSEAPAPAQVGYRFLHGLFHQHISPQRSTLLTNIVRWAYGTTWGGLYGLAEATTETHPLVAGGAFGSLVFANAYIALPAMGLYQPPWQYDAKTLAKDWSYHLVYGTATALAFPNTRARRRMVTSARYAHV